MCRLFSEKLLYFSSDPSLAGGCLEPSPPWVQDFAVPCAELPNTPVSSFLQLVEISLKSSMSIWFINHFSQFVSSADLLRVHSVLSPVSSMKALNCFEPNFSLCGTPQLLGLLLDLSLLVFSPAPRLLIQSLLPLFVCL